MSNVKRKKNRSRDNDAERDEKTTWVAAYDKPTIPQEDIIAFPSLEEPPVALDKGE